MKERPILFSAPMVRAILDGTKAQTRRIVKPQPTKDYVTLMPLSGELVGITKHGGPIDNRGWLHCPYGKPGDQLWVREGAMWDDHHAHPGWVYTADGSVVRGGNAMTYNRRKVPSIHMPRWASRITLEVESVRVDRLWECSEADAKAEGCSPLGDDITQAYRLGYMHLWGQINGPGSWDANPFVWVITFKRIQP